MSEARIPLRARDGSVRAESVVDSADYDWLNQWRWFLDRNGYACRQERVAVGVQKPIFMHRLILGLERGDKRQGDHLNRVRTDNRRANLRIVSAGANAQNRAGGGKTSQYRGVYRAKNGKFCACARLDYKLYHLGTFEDEREAARRASLFRAAFMPHAIEVLA